MNIGKLRHQVNLQILQENQDSYGEMKRDFATYKTVWASIEPLQGRELEHAKQISAEVTHRITIRYLADVVPENRITKGERIFDIESVINPDERNEYLVLMCKELN